MRGGKFFFVKSILKLKTFFEKILGKTQIFLTDAPVNFLGYKKKLILDDAKM